MAVVVDQGDFMNTNSDSSSIAEHVDELTSWFNSYADDIADLRMLLLSDRPSLQARLGLAGVLNYQLKQMDLTPDWVPEIGLLDDIMVIRAGAALFSESNTEELPSVYQEVITRLSEQDARVRVILGDSYEALLEHVRGLKEQKIRGRSPKHLLEDEGALERFLGELDRFMKSYRPPRIISPERMIHKLRSHLKAKLGR